MVEFKRIGIAVLTGSILGILCIIGASTRFGGFAGNELFLFSMWYNRFLMGLIIGLAANLKIVDRQGNVYIRGLLLGFVVSSAFFLSTGFRDFPGFFAGIIY